MNRTTLLTQIKGVGPKTAEQLEAAGLVTVEDAITFLPRRHEDFSEVVTIRDITPGKRTIRARVESTQIKRVRRGMTVTTAVLADDTGKLQAVWFNQPYRMTQFKDTETYFFSGEFEFRGGRYQLTSPNAERVSDMPVHTDRIMPVYRAIRGLKSQVVRKLLKELRPLMTMLPDTLPQSVVESQSLVSYSDALVGLHFPRNSKDIEHARARLGFEELFQLMLATRLMNRDTASIPGVPIAFDADRVKAFVEKLPFQLTNAQRIAAWEIIQDMERDAPMNRLLQGDVGSGKTIVAGLAAYSNSLAGYQTAVMAPTEILAKQHAETLAKLLEPFGVTVGLAVGSVKGKAREALYAAIADGRIAVVVGTHALVQDAMQFHTLGLVVIDEQHRFGVAQRQALTMKAHNHAPHLLAMTATPIPRSLQLTVFGDLDVSILNERPKGRKPIITHIVSPNSAAKTYEAIAQQLAEGRQAYAITPLISDSAVSDKTSVEAELRKLRNSPLGAYRIATLHGRMKPDEKDQVMRDFAAHKYDLLISTTVVEVGVDVPNASVILIENADHFGLAQLHQLRGRVGRGKHQSTCYLMMSDNSAPSQRLREIETSNDGFYLAEVDLRLRGPGEIYGRAQHGQLNLQIASLADSQLIARVQRAVDQFVESGESLVQYKQLAAQVERYQRLTTLN